MQHFTRRQIDVGPKFDDELHAHGPIAHVVVRRHAELGVYVAANCSHWTIANDGQSGMNIHSRSESCLWIAFSIHSLVDKAYAADFSILN